MLANHPRFGRLARWVRCAAVSFCCTGCSICPSPYDDDYGTYGTKTPRTDMRHGRVGSLFSDPAYVGHSGSESIEHLPYFMQEDLFLPEGVIVDEVITEGVSPSEIIIQ